ncbi:DMT family transporter [Aquibaculum sediminis]|uniref:DMT family transporter n=1 Tax=Aquibaculum sediminis TaxID=3231907 RepID=UPI003451AA34
MVYVYLAFAILFETIGTTFLQASQQFSRLVPTIFVILFYAASFYLLSLVLKVMPVGVAYAVWSGLGIVFITAIGWLVFRQTLDLPAVIGIALIITGVLVVNLFSKTVGH